MMRERPATAAKPMAASARTSQLEAPQDPVEAERGCWQRLAPERPAGPPLEQVLPAAPLGRPVAAAGPLTLLVPQLASVIHGEGLQAVGRCQFPLVPEHPALRRPVRARAPAKLGWPGAAAMQPKLVVLQLRSVLRWE